MTRRSAGIREIRRTLRRHSSRILGLPNVLYVGIGEKQVDGAGQRQLCVRVYVTHKQHVAAGDRIPRRLRGIDAHGRMAHFFVSTDVSERPRELTALALRGGDQLRGAGLGSIALAYRSVAGRRLLLTNAHAVAGVDRSAIGDDVRDASGKQRLGTVHRATPLRTGPDWVHFLDAALVAAQVPIEPLSLPGQAPRVVGLSTIRTGGRATYFYVDATGRRRTFTRPDHVETERAVRLGRHRLLFRDFFELHRTAGPPPEPGDSGSLLVRDAGDGLIACGLVFAGSADLVAVLPIRDVFTALGQAWTSTDGLEEDVGIRW